MLHANAQLHLSIVFRGKGPQIHEPGSVQAFDKFNIRTKCWCPCECVDVQLTHECDGSIHKLHDNGIKLLK